MRYRQVQGLEIWQKRRKMQKQDWLISITFLTARLGMCQPLVLVDQNPKSQRFLNLENLSPEGKEVRLNFNDEYFNFAYNQKE